tara:strand:- start:212 stop:388 length:177 start_codon:yes stop_codon:yes gene_type:complete
MAEEKDYNYLNEYNKKLAEAKKRKKTTKMKKRRKIAGLQGLQSFASTYKPKRNKNAYS